MSQKYEFIDRYRQVRRVVAPTGPENRVKRINRVNRFGCNGLAQVGCRGGQGTPTLSLSKNMTDEEFASILTLQYEQHGIEFKGALARTEKPFLAKVVRAVLGMSNRRDGGLIVIGVEETGAGLNAVGLSADVLATWTYDLVAEALSNFADPNIVFDLEIRTNHGRSFVVLLVHEFEDIPVICKQDYPDVLRKGGLYVRARRKPETSEIPSQTEMRELMELAVEKRLRQYLATVARAGVNLGRAVTGQDDTHRFEEQLRDF